MSLLVVDGSNILLRCAFGGDIAPEQATPVAIGMIERGVREVNASHLIVAIDHTDAPSWRKLEHPEYKAHRTVSTAAWLIHGAAAMSARGWRVEMTPGFEADDVIATIAMRAAERTKTFVLSNDSDLLQLTVANIVVIRPQSGGAFEHMNAESVRAKYEIPDAGMLADYKAMVGETGDNIAGVPGIGGKRAASLLHKLGKLDAIIIAGEGGYNRDAELVALHRETARRALRLVTLRLDAAVPPISPQSCRLPRRA
ncbi:MAG: 5'-3' exonuclease H3TH domain-containing protein [bacterium]